MKHATAVAVLALLACGRADAQGVAGDLFARGVPSGQATSSPLPLSLREAVTRGLEHNLGALMQEQRVNHAAGARWQSLSDLLPHVSVNLHESRQLVNAAAYGFTGFPGLPALIGPYSIFDARLIATTTLLDAAALARLRADRATVDAEQHDLRNARELVVLAVASLYLETVTDASRAESARAQARTADALYTLAQDQKTAGVIAGIDVVRQQVQLEAARQRVIAAENTVQKDQLKLARAIGLPLGQAMTLTDNVPFSPAPSMTLAEAVAQAAASRDDLKGAEARVEAARASRRAAASAALPSAHLDADYGALGPTASDTKWTYAIAANVRVPLFQGGSVKGHVAQADADLRQREAELADLRAGVQYEIQTSLLDLDAAAAAVKVAESGDALARQQLVQAQDRFQAGLTNTIELAQAQDAVAAASDRLIESLFAHNLAKAAFAHALGLPETRVSELLGGR